MSTFKAFLKFFLFALLTMVVIAIQWLLLLIHKGKGSYILPQIWHRCVCFIFAIKVQVIGKPNKGKQTVYVGNHLSYLDIPVIGSVLKASFIAKKDVSSWPVFGFLSTLQQTAFISRERADIRQAKNDLDKMIEEGKSLIIFPEGTSTDGRAVFPFKSSLFSVAMKKESEDIYVQPFTIKMEKIDGKDVKTQKDRDIYSWHIDMDTPLATHLWLFAKSKGAIISLSFHDVLKAGEFENRKTLAKVCHEAVSSGLNN